MDTTPHTVLLSPLIPVCFSVPQTVTTGIVGCPSDCRNTTWVTKTHELHEPQVVGRGVWAFELLSTQVHIHTLTPSNKDERKDSCYFCPLTLH